MGDHDDFDWHNSESVVTKTVAGIAVYTNPNGDVIIRQDRLDGDFWDRDPFIVIPHDRVDSVIAALKNEVENQML